MADAYAHTLCEAAAQPYADLSGMLRLAFGIIIVRLTLHGLDAHRGYRSAQNAEGADQRRQTAYAHPEHSLNTHVEADLADDMTERIGAVHAAHTDRRVHGQITAQQAVAEARPSPNIERQQLRPGRHGLPLPRDLPLPKPPKRSHSSIDAPDFTPMQPPSLDTTATRAAVLLPLTQPGLSGGVRMLDSMQVPSKAPGHGQIREFGPKAYADRADCSPEYTYWF